MPFLPSRPPDIGFGRDKALPRRPGEFGVSKGSMPFAIEQNEPMLTIRLRLHAGNVFPPQPHRHAQLPFGPCVAMERVDQRYRRCARKAAQQNFVLSVRLLSEIARNAKSCGHLFGTALLPIGQSLTLY